MPTLLMKLFQREFYVYSKERDICFFPMFFFFVSYGLVVASSKMLPYNMCVCIRETFH